jgi:AGCS family alanine or glycine:cation symporter
VNIFFLENIIENASRVLWGTPFIIFIIIVGIYLTYLFKGVQFTYFFQGWRYLLTPDKENSSKKNSQQITSFQAFINALSASLGNGGLAGMATVLTDGGIATLFWIFLLGFLGMILRFVEVFATLSLSEKKNTSYFGPLHYIKLLPFGKLFVYIYAIVMFFYILCAGIMMQTNSIGSAIQRVFSVDPIFIGLFFVFILIYIIYGGSQRIMRAAEIIIPFKVFLFFTIIIIVLLYHYELIIPAITESTKEIFTFVCFSKGLGICLLQNSMAITFSRGLNATEAGVGTAGIFFGASESKDPRKSSFMSMITAFIATNLVCFLMILALIVSGGMNLPYLGAQLIIMSFSSVFGAYAALMITILGLGFGVGILVSYTFLGLKVWEFLFSQRTTFVYTLLLLSSAFLGSIMHISIVWKMIDLLVGILIFINLLALAYSGKKLKNLFYKTK